jgi:parallel beta-helix repeat protein
MKHLTSALATFCALASAGASAGNILHIANNGIDSPVCGGAATPCRSISQGILNAAAGDTLVVRPGKYGEDGSGSLDKPGEEFGTTIPGSNAGIYVNKRVAIISAAGAEATFINMNSTSFNAVEIAADGVTFGARGAGFTISGGANNGLFVVGANNVRIIGNIATQLPQFGFAIISSGFVEVRGNTAIGNQNSGIVAFEGPPGAYVLIANNNVIANTYGIFTHGAQSPHQLVGNQVIGNQIGLEIPYGPVRVTQNNLNGNNLAVELIETTTPVSSAPVFVRNSFLGNQTFAIDIQQGPAGSSPKIRENNFFGNGFCATNNRSTATVDARNNFWGAATGPSPNDPADDACPSAVPTLTAPFSKREFDIR